MQLKDDELSLERQIEGLKDVRKEFRSCPFCGFCDCCDDLFPGRRKIMEREKKKREKRSGRTLLYSRTSECPCHLYSQAYVKRIARRFVKDNSEILVE